MRYARLFLIFIFVFLSAFLVPSTVQAGVCSCGEGGQWEICYWDEYLEKEICVSTGGGGSAGHGCCDYCGGSCEGDGTPAPPPKQCNSDYIRNCVSGSKTDQLSGENFCVGAGACKDNNGKIVVGSAQALGGCCKEKCTPNPPHEDECWCAGTTVNTYTCCPTGTVNSCQNVPYESWSTTCEAWSNPCGGATFVRWGAVVGGRCAPPDEDGNPQRWREVLCRGIREECSCVPIACNATRASGRYPKIRPVWQGVTLQINENPSRMPVYERVYKEI